MERGGRRIGLGNLCVLDDKLLLRIFEILADEDLVRTNSTSHAFYVLCNEEKLWMKLCLERFGGKFSFQGTWKSTYITESNRSVPSIANPHYIEGNLFFLIVSNYKY